MAGRSLLRPRRRRAARKLVVAAKPPMRLPSAADRGGFSALGLARDLGHALFGDERERQQITLEAGEADALSANLTRRQQSVRADMAVAVGAIGLGLLTPVSPLFYPVGCLAVLWLGRHMVVLLRDNVRRGQLITVPLVTSILVVGMLLTGNLIAAAFSGLFGSLLARLIQRTESSSQRRLTGIFSGHPQSVWLVREGVETQVPFESLQAGDIVVVHAGEVSPVDGTIQDGAASIDQRLLTGESEPVERALGEPVYAATLLLGGRIQVRVQTAGEATVAAGIGRLLADTKGYTETLMLRGRRLADRLLPVELAAGVGTFAIIGPTAAMGVLWSGLGARLVAFGPISVLNYLQILSRRGILIKDGRVLEALGQVDTVVFDKTGTLTLEEPTLCRVHRFGALDEDALLRLAAGAEHRQTHPVARAILEQARVRGLAPAVPDAATYQVGFGIRVRIEGRLVRVGSLRFMRREGLVPPAGFDAVEAETRERGHSLVCIGVDDAVAGMLELAPTIRPEARALIDWLHGRGMRTCIISGDHEAPTRQVAGRLGVDHYFADTLPEHKADHIRRLRDEGRFVCFVGDGINDAVALKSAQVSISLKGASSAATDTAQVIFMDGTLAPMRMLFQTCDELEGTMRGNMALSIVPGVINIAGIYLLHFTLPVSMALFYTGTVAGLANSILPLARHQGREAPPADGEIDQAPSSATQRIGDAAERAARPPTETP